MVLLALIFIPLKTKQKTATRSR